MWSDVKWCDVMQWNGMECYVVGMRCGCAMWLVVRSCDGMWLCDVVNWEMMCYGPWQQCPWDVPFQRAVKPWDAKRNKTTESPCHSTTIPHYKVLLRTIVLQCTTKCYSMLQNYANVPRSTTAMLLRTTLYYSVLHSTTSSAAQGGGGSSKNRKPLREIGCCVSRMAEQKRWWIQLSNAITDQRTIWCSDYVTNCVMTWLTD